MIRLRQEHQDADNRRGVLDHPHDSRRGSRRVVVEHRSRWFAHSLDIIPIGVFHDPSDRLYIGGIGDTDARLVAGFELPNIGDEQGPEPSVLVESTGEVIGPDAVERDLMCDVRSTPLQGSVEQRLSRPMTPLVACREQGVDVGSAMACVCDLRVDETQYSAFGVGD